MTQLTDAKGNITTWTYDAEGRTTRKTYADGSHYDYTYDAAGHLLTRTDAKGKTTAYSYDAAGRLTLIDYPDDPDITTTYDAAGRKLSVTDATGTTTWTYNTAGRVATVDGPFDHDTITVQTDAAGRYTALAVDNRPLSTYAYDTQGRLHTVTGGTALPDGAQPVFTYTYDGASRFITRLDAPNGLYTEKTWDGLDRLASVVNARTNATISSFGVTTDAADRRTRIDLADGGRWEYTYDAAGQLTGGTRYGPKLDNTEGTVVQYGYQYDSMGNPTQRTEDSGVSAYTYNNLNELVTGSWSGTLSTFGWTQTAALDHVQVATGQQSKVADVFQQGEFTAKQFDVPAGDNTFTVTRVATDQTTTQQQTTVTRPADQTQYQHDANGNLLGDGLWTYTWNNENRLVVAEKSGAGVPPANRLRLEFVYDSQGRRRIKKVYTWDTQTQNWELRTQHSFIWLDPPSPRYGATGWLLLETRDVMHNHRTDYLLGTDLSGTFQGAGGIGGILASVTTDANGNTSHQCFLYDFNGNVVNLADPVTASTTATYEYSPFGKLLISTGPAADSNPIRFSTKWQDETGLSYYGYRYYDANVGRWMNRDPLGQRGGYNRLEFSMNCPITRSDVLGAYSYSPHVRDRIYRYNYPPAFGPSWRAIWRHCPGTNRTEKVGYIRLLSVYLDADISGLPDWIEGFIDDANHYIPGGLHGDDILQLRDSTFLGAGITMGFEPASSCCPCSQIGWRQFYANGDEDSPYRESPRAYDFPGTIFPLGLPQTVRQGYRLQFLCDHEVRAQVNWGYQIVITGYPPHRHVDVSLDISY